MRKAIKGVGLLVATTVVVVVVTMIVEEPLVWFFDWSKTTLLPSISGMSFSDIVLVFGVTIGGILTVVGLWALRHQKRIEKVSTDSHKKQLQYRSRLKDEIAQLKLELKNVENPKVIPYPVWICNHDPEQKCKLISNDGEYNIIQKFYTALENRYNHQRSMKNPDNKFAHLNTKCIEAYNAVMKEVIW